MTSHAETKYLPYTARDMFDLVADISAYPEFLPWCAAARVRKEVQKGDLKEIEADLVISFKVFREKFGSRVLLDSSKFIIETDYIDGTFRYCIRFGALKTLNRDVRSNSALILNLKMQCFKV